jgi:hypothetical protein
MFSNSTGDADGQGVLLHRGRRGVTAELQVELDHIVDPVTLVNGGGEVRGKKNGREMRGVGVVRQEMRAENR